MSNFEKLKTFEPLSSSLTIKNSHIHGLGLFAIAEITSGTELGISHVKDDRFSHGYIRTSLGGFFNHSKKPNCKAVYDGDFIKIFTLKNINCGDEITVDYTKHDWIKKDV
ncbi:MAG: SET domain-containing protein [Candidatus Neomarinimicrobiota bacterium]|nr:SET domain-containing protein [Candidatus Neomarinimicrobiota bacterium]